MNTALLVFLGIVVVLIFILAITGIRIVSPYENLPLPISIVEKG